MIRLQGRVVSKETRELRGPLGAMAALSIAVEQYPNSQYNDILNVPDTADNHKTFAVGAQIDIVVRAQAIHTKAGNLWVVFVPGREGS